MDVIENENLQQNALEVGQYLIDGLNDLALRHEGIGDIRGSGLFLAVDLVNDRETREPATEMASKIVNGLRDRGILTGLIGPGDNILKLRPPMVFSKDNSDYFLETVDEVLTNEK